MSRLRVRLKGLLSRGYSLVDVGRNAERNGRDGFLASRVDHFKVVGPGWTDPLPIDVKLAAVPHRFQYSLRTSIAQRLDTDATKAYRRVTGEESGVRKSERPRSNW